MLVSPVRQFIPSSVLGLHPSALWQHLSLPCPAPKSFLPAGPCHVLQHPSFFPLPGIRGQSKETFPLPRLCRLLASACTHPWSRGLTPKQDPATAFVLPSPSPPCFGFLAVPSSVEAAHGFAPDIWEAALVNPRAPFLPHLALRLLRIDIFESCLRLTNQATYYKR